MAPNSKARFAWHVHIYISCPVLKVRLVSERSGGSRKQVVDLSERDVIVTHDSSFVSNCISVISHFPDMNVPFFILSLQFFAGRGSHLFVLSETLAHEVLLFYAGVI